MDNNSYLDIYNNPTELTQDELTYFNNIVNKIKLALQIESDITNYNHDSVKGHKNALGICYTDNFENFSITIDNYYIHECYITIDKPYMNVLGQTLEKTICHEIAHMQQWRHGKKHTELINNYLEIINS